ncbi:MAG: sodium-independent anion transporter [Leptolyngbya sp. SIO4C1]|nr:sodium-independent anion transporter [Leptolyngbya sp. SIO4C1]
MSGPMSYGAARTIAYHMGRTYDVLILDLSDVPLMGVTASLTIEAEIRAARHRQGKIFIVGAQSQVRERLRRFHVQDVLPAENFLPSCYHALATASALLNSAAEPALSVPASARLDCGSR